MTYPDNFDRNYLISIKIFQIRNALLYKCKKNGVLLTNLNIKQIEIIKNYDIKIKYTTKKT